TPFQPTDIGFNSDFRPMANPDLSIYGNGPSANEGLFFTYNRLAWSFSGPNNRPIGNSAYNGLIDANATIVDNTASLDNSWVGKEWVWGNRYELGYVNDDKGWMVSTVHAHQQYNELRLESFSTVPFADPYGYLQGWFPVNGV